MHRRAVDGRVCDQYTKKLCRRGSRIAAQAWQATTRPLCIRVLSQRHVCVDSTKRLGARRLREFVSFLVIIAEGVAMIVCSCNALTDKQVAQVVRSLQPRPPTINEVYMCLGCQQRCRRCAITIKRICDEVAGVTVQI